MSVETPCINICTLDPASRICIGCGRTLDEIARWGTMSGEERKRIVAGLRDRLATFKGTPVPPAR
ncbi:MAG TPA: DUF1289 domain-containing protein [Rhizomicrobium sp.]|jgi:hypothetical protein|nr:DUF1289 domain-containing protein [Rhizomicrobium sp.]